MTSRFGQWTLDVSDVGPMARFWSEVLGYRIDPDEDGGGAHLRPPPGSPPGTLTVWLQPSAGPKRDKNRDHPDLAPADDTTADAELERLLAIGARRVDVGQTGREGFTVLADPEGNEFCLLHRPPAW